MERNILIILSSLATIAAITVFVALLVSATLVSGAREIVSIAIYGSVAVILHLAHLIVSIFSNYSNLPVFLRNINNSFAFLLVAGSYTPIYLVIMPNGWGIALLSVTWAFATAGIILKISGKVWRQKLSDFSFLVTDWLIVAAYIPLYLVLSFLGLKLLALGSLFYTLSLALQNRFAKEPVLTFWKANSPQLLLVAGNMSHFTFLLLYILGE